MGTQTAKNPIKTTRTSFTILQTVADMGGATLPELTARLDLSKGAVYNHLATLEELDVVTKRENAYYVSLDTLRLGERARQTLPGADAAKRKLCDLAETTGEFAALVGYEDERAVVVDTAPGHLSDRTWWSVGETLPLHSTAAGKVVLSMMDDATARELCEWHATDSEPEFDVDGLLEELRTVRVQGLGFSRGEHGPERYSVAAPIGGMDDGVCQIVTLTGPKERLSGKSLQQDVAGLVVSAANGLSKGTE